MSWPWKYIVVSFLIGILLGAAGGIGYSRYNRRRWMRHGPDIFLIRVDREVRLTDSQKDGIRTLLQADREKIRAFHDQIRSATETSIRGMLTGDQVARFDAFTRKLTQKRREMEGR